MSVKSVFFACIIALAFVLRFWQLGNIPVSLTWDEVAWGYNAYSLGLDGRDEFGRFLPVDYLESFGDYKPPVYAYLDIIPVKLFGLTPFAVRVPSALLGTLAVVVTYFLVKRLFATSSKKEWYALVSALILAVSPWHIMLSRAAFEANVASFFILTGVWLFLMSLEHKRWYALAFSVLFFVFSVYTFNSARVVSPLLLGILFVINYKNLLTQKKNVVIAIVVGLFILIPFIHFSLTPQSRLRFQEVNIFSDVSLVRNANQQIANDHNAWWSKILHNRRVVYVAAYMQHYLDNLSPQFLFIAGDGNPKFSTRDVGEMYIWDLPFFVLGILLLMRKKEGLWWFIPVWLLLGIVPAAVARETPHALRIENSLPMFQILVAYGFVEFVSFFKKRNRVIAGVLLGILFLFVLYFQHGYYTHYSLEFSSEWQYGYQEALSYAKSHESSYNHIVITQALGRPYIYTLFYNKVKPQDFRITGIIKRDAFGFVDVVKVGKYLFPSSIPSVKNTLYVVAPSEVPAGAQILQTFNVINGQPSLVAYKL